MMKKNFFLRAAALMWAFALCGGLFVACSDDDEQVNNPAAAPAVKLALGEVTAHSIAFTLTPANAAEARWLCIEESGAGTVTAEQVLANGEAAAADKASTIVAEALKSETAYVIYAAVKGGDGVQVLSEPLKAATAKGDGPDPAMAELKYNTFCGYYFDSELKMGNYVVTLASEWPDEYDYPAGNGDFMVVLDLYGEMSDISDIQLPAGTYQMGQKWTKNVWSPEATAFQIRVDGEVVTSPLLSGTVTVAKEGGEYEIAVDLITTDGVPVKAVYKGELERFYSYGAVNFANFTEDQNVTFEKYHEEGCLYYGNWTIPHSDDFSLVFYTGEMSGPAQQISGYMLHVEAYMHKQTDYNRDPMPIEEGVYNVAAAPVAHQTLAIPMTVNPGMTIEQWGTDYNVFTYLSYVDGRTGARTIGLITGGTMTVTKSGSGYRFDFDFRTDKGVAVTGSYEGDVKMKNRNDTDNPNTIAPMPKRPWSTVKGDVNLAFTEYSEAYCSYMGSYLYPGYDSWMINVLGTDGPGEQAALAGDFLTFEVLVPAGSFGPLPEGTYTIGWGPGDHIAFPGFMTHTAGVFYSWYGDMSSRDSEGVATIMGPINEGTFTVTKTDETPAEGYDGVYHFVFDLKDDASNAIKGEWTGPAAFEDYSTTQPQTVRRPALRLR